MTRRNTQLNKLSSQIIKAAITIHKDLGPGLLESVYQSCMVIELKRMGIKVESEVLLPTVFRGEKVTDQGFRLDLLVNLPALPGGASSQPENASHFPESRHRRLQSEMGLTHFAF